MPYIGKTTDGFGVRNRFVYLASSGDTSVSGADANGATLTFTDGAYVDVYLNGILLKPTTDYNTSTANTIAGLSALNTNDEVTVVVYDVFTVADMVSATSGGTFSGAVTFGSGIEGGVVFNEAGADVDFRVESDNQVNALTVNGENGNIQLSAVPESHHANWTAIDFGYQGFLGHYDAGDTVLATNAYYDGAWKAKETGVSTTYHQLAACGHQFQVGASASADASITLTEAMRIDASARLGVRVVPSGWTSDWRGIDIGDQGHIGEYNGGSTYIMKNGYYDGSNWKYKEASTAVGLNFDTSGVMYIQNAASGSADANITLTSGAFLNANHFWKVRGGYGYFDGTGSFHELNTNQQSTSCVVGIANNASRDGIGFVMYHSVSHSNTNAKHFAAYSSYPGGTADLEFYVRNDGNIYADNNFNSGGADYAELFEWKDGNSSSEDRIGHSVVLDGNKIRKATDSDSASNIIGVISGNPSVVGDSDGETWNGQYLKDDFNRYIYKDSEMYTWTGTKTIGGNEEPQEIVYYKDSLPSDVTVPKDAVTTKCKVKVLNPDYDASKKDSYETRESRKEWSYVGLMGKLRMLKGQPTGDRWIKMRDVSDTVEEWLVR